MFAARRAGIGFAGFVCGQVISDGAFGDFAGAVGACTTFGVTFGIAVSTLWAARFCGVDAITRLRVETLVGGGASGGDTGALAAVLSAFTRIGAGTAVVWITLEVRLGEADGGFCGAAVFVAGIA